MKRWQWLAGGGVLLLLIIVFSLRSTNPRGEVVYTEPVKRRSIESMVSAPGEVDPRVKVNISANVIGKIDRLYFKEGDLVRRGQRLVDIEKATYVAQRARLSSEVANQRINVQRARIQVANSRRQYDRAQAMQKQGIQAQELFDRAHFDLETAQANLAAAEEGVRQAQAGLAQATEDLARTTIHSPIDGKVVQVNAHEGEVVVTGTMNNPGSVIATIADLAEVQVVADVNETEVVRIRPGQTAKVKIDAVQDKEYTGRVVEIGSSATQRPSASGGVRYFKVKISLDEPDDRLRPGMTSQVEIITDALNNILAVPVQSVVERAEDEVSRKKSKSRMAPAAGNDADKIKKKYALVAEEKKVRLREVTTGISDTTHVVIASGLKEGENIITGPFRSLKKLRDGDPVEPQREGASEEKDQKDKDQS